jgi:hypothetical protein
MYQSVESKRALRHVWFWYWPFMLILNKAIRIYSFCSISSLGRYVFGSEISYNKAPPRLPGLGC